MKKYRLTIITIILLTVIIAAIATIATNIALAKTQETSDSILNCGRYSVALLNERGDCDSNPVVRGEETVFYNKYVLYPSGKIYPFLENKTLFASPNLRETFRTTINGNEITPFLPSLSEELLISWEELREGRYRFFNGAEESIFFVPPSSEIEAIRASVEILQKNLTGERLDLSLAHLFLTWRLYSNAIALLWDWQDSSPDANLMLAQAFRKIELPLSAENVRSKFVADLAEKVLFFEFVSKDQTEKAIELIRCTQ